MIICLLIPLSTVSASDINNTAADNQVLSATPSVDALSASVNPEQDNDTLSVQENEILSAGQDSGSNEILADSGTDSGTLKDLKNLMRNVDSLNLTKDYVYSLSSDSSFNNGFIIDHPITIDGKGYTINMDSNSFLTINSQNVILKNINIINSKQSTITAYNVELNNVNFKNSSYLALSSVNNVNITDSTFEASPVGQLLFINSCFDIKVTNCTFKNVNHTNARMAAPVEIEYSDNVFFDYCLFDDINGSGGAASPYGSAAFNVAGSNVFVSYCNFTNMLFPSRTPVQIVASGKSEYNYCIFENISGDSVFYNYNAPTDFNKCTFKNNDVIVSMYVSSRNTNIKNSTFNNSGTIKCGIESQPGTGLTITHTNFTNYNNKANIISSGPLTTGSTYGSSIWTNMILIDDCLFSDNNVTNIADFGYSDYTTVKNSIFNGNTVTNAYFNVNNNTHFNNISNIFDNTTNLFNNNTILDFDSMPNVYANPENITTAITSVQSGGIIYLMPGTYVINDDNHMSNYVGLDKNNVKIENSTLTKITSIKNVTLVNTQVNLVSGYTIDNCNFTNNSYLHGTRYIQTGCGRTGDRILNTEFNDRNNPIALPALGSLFTMENVTFNRCTGQLAYNTAGNIPLVTLNNITVKNSQFTSISNGFAKSNVNGLTIINSTCQGLFHVWTTNWVIENVNLTKVNITLNYGLAVGNNCLIDDFKAKDINITSNIILFHGYPSLKDSIIRNVDLNNVSTLGNIVGASDSVSLSVSNFNISDSKNVANLFVLGESSLSKINVDNVNFTDSLGVINGKSTIDDSEFNLFNGSLMLNGENTRLNNVKFIKGNASNNGNGTVNIGAELIILDNCTFTDNYASDCGGAIYVSKNASQIIKSTFTDNRAANNGTGIFYMPNVYYYIDASTRTTLNFTEDIIDGVYALGTIKSFDVIYINQSGITGGNVVGSMLEAFMLITPHGTIYVIGNNQTFDFRAGQSLMKNNVTFIGGNSTIVNILGHITIDELGSGYTVENVTFRGAPDKVFEWNGADGKIVNCTFEYNGWNATSGDDNASANYGAAIDVEGENLKIINSTFRYNHANGDDPIGGGAIYYNSAGLRIENSHFDFNQAKYAPGSDIYVTADAYGAVIENTTFNNATGNSAIHIEGYDVTFNDCNFTNNTANQGSALYIDSSIGKIDFNDCNFINNSATNDGGALYIVKGDEITITSNFTNNSAVNGGAIYSNAAIDIVNSNFTNNSAVNGGALYLNSKGSVLNNTDFTYNTATNGSAIYISKDNDATLYNVVVDKNGIDDQVYGDIYLGDGSLYIPNDDLTLGKLNDRDQFIYVGNYTSDVLYISPNGDPSATGLTTGLATTLDHAIEHISNGGKIIAVGSDDTFTYNTITFNNLTNVTIVGNNKKFKTTDGKYLFILAIFEDHFKISVMLFFCRYSLSLILSCLIL